MKTCLRFCIIFLLCCLFFPIRAVFSEAKPSIHIVSPEKDSTVSSTRVTLQFSIENFILTAKPDTAENAGVVNIYVNGAFFNNIASSSAQLSLPRQGTHFIEAELVKVSRDSFTPRIVDTMYINAVKETPYLRVMNVARDQVLYQERPTLDVDLVHVNASEGYYTVFVDGVVDGDSKLLENVDQYPLSNPLTEGRHTIKLALYSPNGKPFSPVAEYTLPISYSSVKPELRSVELPKEAVLGEPVSFKVEVKNFNLGRDGFLSVTDGRGDAKLYDKNEGEITGLAEGMNTLAFTLYDSKGRALFAEPPFEKVIEVKGAQEIGSGRKPFSNGIFLLPQDGAHPQWVFIALAVVEAFAILTFAILLFKKHKH